MFFDTTYFFMYDILLEKRMSLAIKGYGRKLLVLENSFALEYLRDCPFKIKQKFEELKRKDAEIKGQNR